MISLSHCSNRVGIKQQMILNLHNKERDGRLPVGRLVVERDFAKEIELVAFALCNGIDEKKSYEFDGVSHTYDSFAFHNQTLRAVRYEWIEYLKNTFRVALMSVNGVYNEENPVNCVNFCAYNSYEMTLVYNATINCIASSLAKAFFFGKSSLLYEDEEGRVASVLILPDTIGT